MICLAISFKTSRMSGCDCYLKTKRRSGVAVAAADHGEDLVLAQDHEILVVDLDLAAGVLADQDAVALLDVHRGALAIFEQLARTDGDHLGLLRLFLGGVGSADATAVPSLARGA